MKVLGFTVDELRRLMETRSVLLKMLQSPYADREVIAWAKRHGSAEVIQLDDFRYGRVLPFRRSDTTRSYTLDDQAGTVRLPLD